MRARPSDWLDTPALCQELSISRSTLSRWRQRGLLRSGHHWARKNPACPRSDLLWHRQRCLAALGSSAREASGQQSCRCPQTPHGQLIFQGLRQRLQGVPVPLQHQVRGAAQLRMPEGNGAGLPIHQTLHSLELRCQLLGKIHRPAPLQAVALMEELDELLQPLSDDRLILLTTAVLRKSVRDQNTNERAIALLLYQWHPNGRLGIGGRVVVWTPIAKRALDGSSIILNHAPACIYNCRSSILIKKYTKHRSQSPFDRVALCLP